jgi:DNA-binding CsgD family transcriptional regulator
MQRIRTERGELVILSPREREVLRLAALGLTNDEIARRLGIETSTIRSHLGRVMCDLDGVSNRVELTRWVLTFPGLLAGEAASPYYHPEKCDCGAPFCVGLRGKSCLDPEQVTS